MTDSPAQARLSLLQSLENFHDLVAVEPLQPRQQIAEGAVMHWIRVAEGKESVQPRLTESGDAPASFHLGMEPDPENWIDHEFSAASLHDFREALTRRLDTLGVSIERYVHAGGYRNSPDQCDRMMVELAHLSRFLGAWVLVGEREIAARDGKPRVAAQPSNPDGEGMAGLLQETRQAMYLWELPLNQAIVAWEENSLGSFAAALKQMEQLLAMASGERSSIERSTGLPMRRIGRRRSKISVFSPDQRMSRSKSMFGLRFNQLIKIVESLGDEALPLIEPLHEDVLHLLRMVGDNNYMLAAPPGFLQVGRPGSAVIRARPASHPFFLDPMGFFKKAVLFHNGTYTRAGGGLDLMYMQVMQLWRYLRFHAVSSGRGLLPLVEACEFAWEENRWDAFREHLLMLAIKFRDGAQE